MTFSAFGTHVQGFNILDRDGTFPPFMLFVKRSQTSVTKPAFFAPLQSIYGKDCCSISSNLFMILRKLSRVGFSARINQRAIVG